MYCLYRNQDFVKTFSQHQPSSASELGYASIVLFNTNLESGFLDIFIAYCNMFSGESQVKRYMDKRNNRQRRKFDFSKENSNDVII